MSASSKCTRGLRAFRINHAVCCAALTAVGMFAGERAFAGDLTWVRAAGNPGSFADGANWVGGVAPIAGDNTFINNGGIATATAAVNSTFNDLRIGFTAASSGSLSITGGTINAQGNAAFGSATTGAGTLLMSSGALNVGGGLLGDLSIGDDGAGTMSLSGGTITTRFAFLGKSTNGYGFATQSGGSLLIQRNFVMAELKPANLAAVQNPSTYTMSAGFMSVGSEMYIGAHGPATFNLSNTGSITVVGTVHVGASGGQSDPPAGVGSLNMTGGSLSVTGPNTFIGIADHGDGTCNRSGGTVSTKFYNIGQNYEPGFSTRGLVNHTGGSVVADYAWVIAELSRSANLYDLSGGTVTVNGAGIDELPGNLNIASGPGSKGALIVRGTGVAKIGNSVLLANSIATAGSLTVGAGGSLSLGLNGGGTGFLVVGGTGTGIFQMTGGSVVADGMTLGQNTGALGTGTQTAGGFVVRNSVSVGETSTGANVYDITGGTLAVGTAGVGGIFVGSAGAGTLKIGGTAVVTSQAAIENANAGTGTIAVSGGSVTAPSMANRGAYGQTGGVASLGSITGLGSISVSGGTLNAASISQGTLAISANGVAKIAVNGTNTGLSVVDSLSVTGSGKLDLTDNDLIVHNGSYATITSSIRTARNGGLWNQAGITSSTAAAANPKNKTLGTVSGTQYFAAQGAGAQFDGTNVSASDILVKYTYYGDADLNGVVNFDDYSRIDGGFNSGGTTWFQGDFDYNGMVNFDDYSLIDNAFNTQSGSLRRALSFVDGSDRSETGMDTPALQLVVQHFTQFGEAYATGFLNAVPEPTSALALAGLAALSAGKRRRRTKA
ncbi:hypothetical protein BH09PLA1_BH09PLA1_18280 [soil metagenome]